ncbi:MAG TPA: hypothetical protein IGS40_19795 [Trichormus sp. M33_DOE_039]|nr:hypothetical protein [Trichormus sp. M33_DOE_039]
MQSRQAKKPSNAPEPGMFQERSLAVQPKKAKKSQQPDLKTSLMQAEQYGHHLNQMNFAAQSTLNVVQPVQCAGGFGFNQIWNKRPPKPKPVPGQPNPGLQQTDPTLGTLTAHHKYGLQDIKHDLQHPNVLGHPNPTTTPQGQNFLHWADPTSSKPTLTHSDVAWTAHNIFMGPKPEHRLDDPGKVPGALHPDLDTHFTESGTVTPASELALDIHQAGGIPLFNHQDLINRLNALPNAHQASSFNPAEWTQVGGKWQQTGMPSNWHQMSIQDRIKYAEESQTYSFLRNHLFK